MGSRPARGKGSSLPRMRKKADLPQKPCLHCGRPMVWRKRWEKTWDAVKFCSDRCRTEARQPAKAGIDIIDKVN